LTTPTVAELAVGADETTLAPAMVVGTSAIWTGVAVPRVGPQNG
jgi:hypothetical protein